MFRRVSRRARYEVFRRRVERANRRFDQSLGTDTAAGVAVDDLGVSEPQKAGANAYECMHEGSLLRALRGLGVDLDEYEFIDLGSGKGKTLLVASMLPFARVTGVEFSEALHRVAESNLTHLAEQQRVRCRDVRSVCADVRDHREAHSSVIVFMMNPFGAELMRDVVAWLDDHLADSARRGIVIYSNPVHHDVVETSATLDTRFRAPRLAVYSTTSAGLDPVALRRNWGRRFDRWSVSRERCARPLRHVGPTVTVTGAAAP